MNLTLSPLDIRNKEFKKTVLGYAPNEVAEFLDLTSKVWETMLADQRDLQEKVKTLTEEVTRWKNRELEVNHLRDKALKEAEQIRAQAQQDAEKLFADVEDRANGIRLRTEEWLVNVIAEVEETERQKNNFMAAFKSALDSHYELLRNGQEESEPLGAKLSHFLKTATSGAGATGN